jgi:hypothetical protein
MFRSALLAFAPTLALLSTLLMGSCDVVVGYRDVDPEIDLEVMGPSIEVTGTPSLDIGFYHEQLYEPLHDGDNSPIVSGLQGGTWIMPALRIDGIYPFAETRCTLTVETGEVVGKITATTRYFLATDDIFEVQAFPVPVIHATPKASEPIDDLYGLGATLSCEVFDGEGRTGTAIREIILVDG